MGKLTFFRGNIPTIFNIQIVKSSLKLLYPLRVFKINDIFNFCQNSRWWTKFWKFNFFSQALYLRSLVPKGSKQCSKSLYLLRVFEINDIFNFHQNPRWQPKSRSQDKCIFNAEIQDGHQKWPQSDFCEMSPVHSADTLRVKNFIKIAQSHTVSRINALLHFMQKIKMAAKSGGKAIFGEKPPIDSADTLRVKKSVKITLSRTVSKINALLHFTQKFKMAAKSCGNAILA